jgi:colanic acid/amylovoran biosynthesis glycosyltransferase
MRVVHFVESFSPLTETFVYDLVLAGSRRGLDSWVLTLRRANPVTRPFNKVREISLPPRWSPERLWSRLRVRAGRVCPHEQYSNILQRRIRRFLSSQKTDVVHAHFGPIGYLILPVAQALGIPLVVSFYGYDVTRQASSDLWRSRYEKMLRSADALVALSNVMREQLLELGASASKIRVVHLGKRVSEYVYQQPHSPVLNWVSVGRLVEKKGHLDCIKAFAIAMRDTDATLTIVGDGEDRQALTDEVAAQMLSQRVHLAGSLPHPETLQTMREADAFVLCSKKATDGDTEGTPVVLLEAQALGLPCVATRHSAIPEVIAPENHRFLAEEGNVRDIAARMALLSQASQEELVRFTEYGRRKVEREYDVDIEAGRLLEVYACAISAQNGC